MTSNVAASIRARLHNKLSDKGAVFQLFLDRYACERFLYRLGKSEEQERCILKGATLLGLWMKDPYRATRDIDLLVSGESDEEAVRRVMTTICNIPCPEDGLVFEIETLRISPIRGDKRYGGQRAKLRALLGKARASLQVDFGYGDIVTQATQKERLPTLISGVPAPVVRTYPRVTTIAEKFEAMAQLGIRNSRMKDFHDIWALSEAFPFDGAKLQEAVARCFERRGTSVSAETPDALASAFYSNMERQDQWQAYGNQMGLLNAPPDSFEEVGIRIQSFLGPVHASILADETFDLYWPAAGPWQAHTGG